MKIIDPSYKILDLNFNYQAMLLLLERAARVCYKSEGAIKSGSDIKLIEKIIGRGHEAMLEHAYLILEVSKDMYTLANTYCSHQYPLKFLVFTQENNRFLISGNIRAFRDFHRITKCRMFSLVLKTMFPVFFDDLEYYSGDETSVQIKLFTDIESMDNIEKLNHLRLSVHFICCRGFTHEIVRMRLFSFAQESSRYVDYFKGKQGKGITVIRPNWSHLWKRGIIKNKMRRDFSDIEKSMIVENWAYGMQSCEAMYMSQRLHSVVPQFARENLPIGVKTEIITTGTFAEWHHVFGLRVEDVAHPSMHQLMRPLLVDVKKKYVVLFDQIPDEPQYWLDNQWMWNDQAYLEERSYV